VKLVGKIAWRLALAAVVVLVGAALWVRFSTAGCLYADAAVIPARDVALVLGASVFRSGKPSPVVEARLRAALKLLESGKVQRILVSGAHKDDYDEADAMRAWLVHEGVPAAQIAVDQAGQRTLDSVVRAGDHFGAKSLVVCTQAFHLPRAVFLARRAGIDALGLRVGANLSDTSPYDLARESLATVRAVFDAQFLTARASSSDQASAASAAPADAGR
jgi:SanA protein